MVFYCLPLKRRTMKKEQLSQLIEKTFAKLACPMPGVGLYSELQKALTLAFEMGKEQEMNLESMLSQHLTSESVYQH